MRSVFVVFVLLVALLVPDESHAVHVPRLLDRTLSFDVPLQTAPDGLKLTLIDRGAGADEPAYSEPNVVVQGLASLGVQALCAFAAGFVIVASIGTSPDLMSSIVALSLSLVGYGLLAPLASSYAVVSLSGNPNASVWATYGASLLARLVASSVVSAVLVASGSTSATAAGALVYLGAGAVAEVIVANWNHPAWRDESSAKARAQQLAPVGSGLTLASMSF